MQQTSAMQPFDSLKLLYYSYIHSNILYGVLVWGSIISKKALIIWNANKRVLQIIMKLNKRDSITFKFKENGILLFKIIIKLELC